LLGLEIRKLARKKNERDNGRRGNIFGRGNSNKSRDVVDKTLLSSGRQTAPGGSSGVLSKVSFLSRRHKEYHTVDLTQYADTFSADKMLDILIDSNPDVSQAVYSFLRVCNSGFFYKVKNMDGSVNEGGQAKINEWVRRLDYQQTNKGFKEDRSFNSLVNKMHLSFFVKGACCSEVVLNKSLEPVYIVPVSPSSIDFKRDGDELIP
ncbi:MAG: hypothetical protein KAX15_01165, partial [Candidatus Omnitrophica bacterium]|nr:hypothetical protein [Candidatus Omnitrophota bacterium]